jgi:hypothetical protein
LKNQQILGYESTDWRMVIAATCDDFHRYYCMAAFQRLNSSGQGDRQ